MLVQLDQLPEVQRSYSNYSGTLLRIISAPEHDSDAINAAVSEVLKASGRNPVAMSGEELSTALTSETWRDADRIGELTLIEYATFTWRGLKYALPALVVITVGIVWWRKGKKRFTAAPIETENLSNEE